MKLTASYSSEAASYQFDWCTVVMIIQRKLPLTLDEISYKMFSLTLKKHNYFRKIILSLEKFVKLIFFSTLKTFSLFKIGSDFFILKKVLYEFKAATLLIKIHQY